MHSCVSNAPPSSTQEALSALFERGAAALERRDFLEAETCYRMVCGFSIPPEVSRIVFNNLGIALKELGKFEEALICFGGALQVQPDCAITHTNQGSVFSDLKRYGEAAASYLRAIKLDPDCFLALNNLGNLLKADGRFSDALVFFSRALCLRPDSSLLHNNIGSVLSQLGRPQESIQSFRRAVELDPENNGAFSNLLLGLNYLGGLDRAELFAEHCRFEEHFGVPLRATWKPHSNSSTTERRLRVGFVSGDLRMHPVANFIEPIFEKHDRSDFEYFAYANQPEAESDAVTSRLRGQVEHWCNIHGLTDEQVAELIRGDQIDILVDLSGHTARNRMLVFARKPAPIQIAMIGYMQTTGLRAMDYRITDAHLDPVGLSEKFNSERLIRLPSGAAPFRPPLDCPPVNNLPALSNGYVTFGSFNNFTKVGREVLQAWSEILNAVPSARMIIVAGKGNNALEVLTSLGVQRERVEIIERQPLHEYLKLHHRVDVLLDAFPYAGGTTNLIAAWMGVPFISINGTSPTQRAGCGILAGAGLHQCIAADVSDYVNRSILLSRNFEELRLCRASSRHALRTNLGDGSQFVIDLENALRSIWETKAKSITSLP